MNKPQLAKLISDNMTYRNNRYMFKDDAPEVLRNWFMDATTNDLNFAELDDNYTALSKMAETVAYEDNDAENEYLEDLISCYDYVPVYTADLLEWLSSDLSRTSDIDDQIANGVTSVTGAISNAMQESMSNKALIFFNALDDLAERLNK